VKVRQAASWGRGIERDRRGAGWTDLVTGAS